MNPRPHLFGLLAGLFLAGALCFASLVVAGAWTKISDARTISVTGSARKNVRSDLVVWRASFSTDASTLLEAQQKLAGDLAKVAAWLDNNGVRERTMKPVQIRELLASGKGGYADGGEPATAGPRRLGYQLTQALTVTSPEVERIPRLAGDTGALLGQGVAFVSEGFEFIYTKAGEAKVEMMAEATKDARARAEQIAAQGGRGIKELRSARMGVIQINPLYSGAASWDGNNDTTSLEKTVTATINASFSLK